MGKLVELQLQGHVAILTLRRPEKLNALNRQIAAEFDVALNSLGGARALVVTGGPAVFSAGADLSEIGTAAPPDAVSMLAVLERMAVLPLPTVAAIEGYCFGGGLELALCCDMRIAGQGAQFATPEVTRGILPGGGGTQRLPRLIGPERAKRLMFTGGRIDTATAERWGLVSQVVADGDALKAATELAGIMVANAPLAILAIKRVVDGCAYLDLGSGLASEREEQRGLLTSEDVKEGVLAFFERRLPVFQGR